MRKFIYLTLLSLFIVTGSEAMNILENTKLSAIFFNNGKLTVPVKNIFQLLGHPVETLEEALTFAQKNLLRVGERWDEQKENNFGKKIDALKKETKEEITEELKSLHMIQGLEGTKKQYNYALLMGATKDVVKKRMNYLADLVAKGITFDYIVLLGGVRPLRENENNLPENITTELEMMYYLYNKNNVLCNDTKHELLMVNAPMIKRLDGTGTRPTTDSTVKCFAQQAPVKGTCLVISHNPYIIRQTLCTKRILHAKGFDVEGAGMPAADMGSLDICMAIDEFARTLYEVYKDCCDQ